MRVSRTWLLSIWSAVQAILVFIPKPITWFLTLLGIAGAEDDLAVWRRWLADETSARIIAIVLLLIGIGAIIFRRGRPALTVTGELAQSTAATSTGASMPSDSKIPPGASGNFNLGQQGGTVHQVYNNFGPQRLQLTDGLARELVAALPKAEKITVHTIGNSADQAVGESVISFLLKNGYTVEHHRSGMMIPAPNSKIEWNPATRTLTVAPSA